MKLAILVMAFSYYAGAPTWERGNDLAMAYQDWAELGNERVQDPAKTGTVSVPERRAWTLVKSRWRSLEAAVESEYGGR